MEKEMFTRALGHLTKFEGVCGLDYSVEKNVEFLIGRLGGNYT